MAALIAERSVLDCLSHGKHRIFLIETIMHIKNKDESTWFPKCRNGIDIISKLPVELRTEIFRLVRIMKQILRPD